jgi:hypothetical protein
VFAGFHETDRLPWHGPEPVRIEYLPEGYRFAVRDDDKHRLFDDPAAYLAWWRAAHPGEVAEYPWALHDRAYSPEHRASRRDRPSFLDRLRSRISLRGRDRE